MGWWAEWLAAHRKEGWTGGQGSGKVSATGSLALTTAYFFVYGMGLNGQPMRSLPTRIQRACTHTHTHPTPPTADKHTRAC